MKFYYHIYQLFKAGYRNNVDLIRFTTIIKDTICATVTNKDPQFIISDIIVGQDYFIIITPMKFNRGLKKVIGSAIAKIPELGQYTVNYYKEDGAKKKSGHLFKCGSILTVNTEIV